MYFGNCQDFFLFFFFLFSETFLQNFPLHLRLYHILGKKSISFLKYFSENLKIPKNSIKGLSRKFQKIFQHIFQKFQKILDVQRLKHFSKKGLRITPQPLYQDTDSGHHFR